MKDFDTSRNTRLSRERSFKIGGEVFTYRPSVAPESILGWSRMTGGEFNLKDEQGKPVLGPQVPMRDAKGELMFNKLGELLYRPGDPISTLSEQDAIRVYDQTILAFMEPGQDEKWQKVRNADAENPLSVQDLSDLIQWLFEEVSGRPTEQPSGSSNGSESGGTGTNLTAVSASPVAPA